MCVLFWWGVGIEFPEWLDYATYLLKFSLWSGRTGDGSGTRHLRPPSRCISDLCIVLSCLQVFVLAVPSGACNTSGKSPFLALYIFYWNWSFKLLCLACRHRTVRSVAFAQLTVGAVNMGYSGNWDQMGGRAGRGARRAPVTQDITRFHSVCDLEGSDSGTYRVPPVRT